MLSFAQPKYFRYYYEEINRTVHTVFDSVRFSGFGGLAAAVHKMFMMMVNFLHFLQICVVVIHVATEQQPQKMYSFRVCYYISRLDSCMYIYHQHIRTLLLSAERRWRLLYEYLFVEIGKSEQNGNM